MRMVIGDALHSLTDLGSGGAAAGRQRIPRRREDAPRGQPGLVGGPSAVRGGQSPDRQHGAQGRRLHLPGTQPDHRRHPRDRRGRRRPVLRLHQPARLSTRAGHRRHRIPAADPADHPRTRCRPGVAGARPAEPRRTDLRTGALVDRSPRRRLSLQRRRDHRRRARRVSPQRPDREADRCRTRRTTWCSPPTASPAPRATVIAATLGITDLDADRATSTGSGGRTCCWRCSTRCSPGCSRCPAGICAACSRCPSSEVAELLRGRRHPVDPPRRATI